MRLRPGYILAATVAIIVLPIIVTLAVGGEVRDLPLGAMAVGAIAGAFIARRAAGRRSIDDLDEGDGGPEVTGGDDHGH